MLASPTKIIAQIPNQPDVVPVPPVAPPQEIPPPRDDPPATVPMPPQQDPDVTPQPLPPDPYRPDVMRSGVEARNGR